VNATCFPIFVGKPCPPDRIGFRKTVSVIGVLAAAAVAGTVVGFATCAYMGGTVALFISGAAPVVAHITGSHVRVEPGRVAMIRDFLFFKDVLEIPRELVEGAEVVKTTVKSGRETVRRTLVRIHLKDRGYMPLTVRDPEKLAEELGGARSP